MLTVAQAEHLIATWIVKVWQNRELGEYAPAWDPGTRHSPNSLFAAAMGQGGSRCRSPLRNCITSCCRCTSSRSTAAAG